MKEMTVLERKLLVYEDGTIWREKKNRMGITHFEKLNQYKMSRGHMFILVRTQKFRAVHRLVAEAFVPNPHGYPFVGHKDNNPENNAADNLFWCTRACICNRAVAVHRHMLLKNKVTTFSEEMQGEYNMEVNA